MKKTVLLLTTVVISVNILTACGGNSNEKVSAPTYTPVSTSTPEPTTYINTSNAGSIHEMLLGEWVQPNANLIWIYKEDEFIIDYSEAYPGDYSSEATKVRALPASHVSYTMDGEYLICTMGQVNYKNKIKITGNVLEITNSISGQIQKYYRKNTDTQITAKHILVQNYDVAVELLNRIKNGEDFDTLMNEYTEDPGTANNPNGYTFERGDMV